MDFFLFHVCHTGYYNGIRQSVTVIYPAILRPCSTGIYSLVWSMETLLTPCVESVNIALPRFLHNHGDIATEGSPKSGLCPTLIE